MRVARRNVLSPVCVLGLSWLLGACHGSISDAGPGAAASAGHGAAAASGGASTASGGTGGATGGSGTRGGTGGGGGSAGQAQGPALTALESGVRRLTRSELDATVRDLFADDTSPARKVLAEDEFNPFDNDYTLQRASSALIDSLEAFAEDVAARALSAAQRDNVVPCTPTDAGDTACFRSAVSGLGLKLFRRPLTNDEIDAYATLQSFSTEDNPDVAHDFYTGVELALRSMLQDPEFLYRIEVGTAEAEAGVFRLNDYELATRLSFLLWGSTPSSALLTSAANGGLSASAARRTLAAGLLDDEHAKDTLHRFHAMWLGYRSIPASAELAAAFDLETTHLIDRVVFDEQKSYLDLFLSPETYINDLLADQYGLPHPSGGEGWVQYGSSGREGILSHGSVLAAFSKFSDTSPTQRGIFVQTRLLCNTVDPPPANVNVDQPPSSGDSVCKFDRYAAHRTTSSCASCHNNLDPIGFGLEQYDIGGRLRTHDDGHAECTITGEGELPGYGTFSGPAELAEKLVGSGELSGCFVQQWLSYALGRHVTANEAGVVDELSSAFADNGYAAKDLLLDYVASDRFALRREEPAP